MTLFSGSRPTGSPTARGLMVGKAFTAIVFVLVLVGMVAAVFAGDSAAGRNIAAGAFVAASLVYLIIALVMYMRGDYILRMFGCGWPLVLAKADELQKAQRQRAFSFTFIVFLSGSSIWLGAHVGAMAAQHHGGDPLTGLFPGEPWAMAAVLVFVYFTLALLPQAYLAWTLTPLDEEEDE